MNTPNFKRSQMDCQNILGNPQYFLPTHYLGVADLKRAAVSLRWFPLISLRNQTPSAAQERKKRAGLLAARVLSPFLLRSGREGDVRQS